MIRVWIGLGSNLGDRRAHLEGAVEALRSLEGFRVLRTSDWITTEPVGGPAGQPLFLNGVLEGETALPARALLSALHRIERAHGRVREREERNGPRSLDLDLLLYGDDAIEEPDLVVPHPRLEERTFVLEPLARLAPALRLSSGLTVSDRLKVLDA